MIRSPPILSEFPVVVIRSFITIHLLLLWHRHLIVVSHADDLVSHGLLLVVECVAESPKLLRLR